MHNGGTQTRWQLPWGQYVNPYELAAKQADHWLRVLRVAQAAVQLGSTKYVTPGFIFRLTLPFNNPTCDTG